MRVHRELFIRGDAAALEAVAEDIRRSLTDKWGRDEEAEERMREGAARKVYCFVSPKWPRQPKATVFLIEKDQSTLYVANIVPADVHELSRDEYNAILADFYSRYAQPAALRQGATAELTEADVDLEHWLPEPVAEKLRRFSRCANKSSGSAHPADRQLWYDFLASAQESGVDLSSGMLERWLVEEGWDEEVADRLAGQYNFARGLLEFVDGLRVGA